MLTYIEFRELFTSHRIAIPEIYLYCNWEYKNNLEKEIFIPQFEFIKMRQLVLILTDFISDNNKIFSELTNFNSNKIFDYFLSFNKNNTCLLYTSPSPRD